jgi:hypothetical protein
MMKVFLEAMDWELLRVRPEPSKVTLRFDRMSIFLKLDTKKPTQKEAIDKIKEQLNQIPNIPTREKGELPNHLEYLKEDIQVNNKLKQQLGLTNLDYVEKTLKAVKETNPTATCWNEIESNLKRLHWWSRTK